MGITSPLCGRTGGRPLLLWPKPLRSWDSQAFSTLNLISAWNKLPWTHVTKVCISLSAEERISAFQFSRMRIRIRLFEVSGLDKAQFPFLVNLAPTNVRISASCFHNYCHLAGPLETAKSWIVTSLFHGGPIPTMKTTFTLNLDQWSQLNIKSGSLHLAGQKTHWWQVLSICLCDIFVNSSMSSSCNLNMNTNT